MYKTLKHIRDGGSLARFGDGEFLIINGQSIHSQEYNKELAEKLRVALSSEISATPKMEYAKDSVKRYFKDYQEYDSNFNSFISLAWANTNINHTAFYREIMKIWQGKDIVVVCGDHIEKSTIFAGANVEYIQGLSRHSFRVYKELIKKLRDVNKPIYIMLGATGTVLAYDLWKMGKQAVDIGHISKDYDWYLKVRNVEKNVKEFFIE